MKAKERLDNMLIQRALFASREAARTAIMDGAILVNGQKVTKAGTAINVEAQIEIIKSYNLCPYVSRGGLKLEKGLQYFALDVSDRVAIDGGASTGGFTDCLLQNGASLVYAVDVGHGQIDWKLRQDPRVKVFEKVNLRNLKALDLYGHDQTRANLAVMDVSFISVTKTLPSLIDLLDPIFYELLILIKPQFEAGRLKVSKGGVVRDQNVHREVLDTVISFVQANIKLLHLDLTFSPLKGPSGNIEYLLYLNGGQAGTIFGGEADAAVAEIQENLVNENLVKDTVQAAFDSLGAP